MNAGTLVRPGTLVRRLSNASGLGSARRIARTLQVPIVSFALILLAPVSHATEPLEASELRRFCLEAGIAGDSTNGRLCETYVLGFLDGAIATDGRVAANVAAEIDRDESLSERAVRTRGVARRLESFGETVYADFCVGTPVPIAEVLTRVLDELESADNATQLTAREIVYAALQRHYSCTEQTE